jgi:hypothetical protein
VKKYLSGLYRVGKALITDPYVFAKVLNTVPYVCGAYDFSRAYKDISQGAGGAVSSVTNPLWDYFQNHKEGHGIWKWEHYFEIYHRHFARFVGKKVNVLEVGVYSGGSLEMWRSYFGKDSRIYGVDIEAACKAYENDQISIFIGDQADRDFWSKFRSNVEGIDILIDDGGHLPEQQQITLEEMLPYLRPGGVYLCEDVHGAFNRFGAFVTGLVNGLNKIDMIEDSDPPQSRISQFQSLTHSIHFYPYVVVIEKHGVPPDRLSAPKHGTEWQPFFESETE